MTIPPENEWSRSKRLRKDPCEAPSSKISTRTHELREGGESAQFVSVLELHRHLSHQTELCPGRRLANRYIVKEKIGEGGMGVVYEAVQEMTQQEVALKIIHPELISPTLIKRFREEIRALGKLQHDYIVRVFDADYDRNAAPDHELLFYAMQLVHGLPLIRWANEFQPTVEARLECFVHICEAVDYAHRQAVVHRDLKPDNILVGAGGRPAILDFGLAQIMDIALEASMGPQASGDQAIPQVSGTPAYMSRERWEGHPGRVPADVFALGVLLHEVLTGTRPWRVTPDASIKDLCSAIYNFSPDQLKPHPALNRPLLRLLGSMLAPNPAARPPSAGAVASAIRTIRARKRLIRRFRRSAPIWAGVAVAVGSVTATQIYHAKRKQQERESQRLLGLASEIVSQRSQVDTLAQVINLLPKKPKLRHSQDQWREVVIEAMATWNLNDHRAVQLPTGFEPQTSDLQGARFFGHSTTGAWELIQRSDRGWLSRRFPSQQGLLRTRINPRQSQLAALSAAGELVVWEWEQNRQTTLRPSAETDVQFEFSPDGLYLACSATISHGADIERSSAVRVFDTRTWKEMALLFKGSGQPEPGNFIYVRSRPIAGLAFSPNGNLLAVWSSESSYLLIWDWSNEKLLQFARHDAPLAAAAWRGAPAEGEIATLQGNGQIRVWKLPQLTKPGDYLDPGDAIEWGRTSPTFRGQITWAPGEEVLAAVDEVNETMEIFAADTGAGPFRVVLGSSSIGRMRWLSAGLVRSVEKGHEWVPFDSNPPICRVLSNLGFIPAHLAFNPSGTILAAADDTRIVFIAPTTGAILGSPLEMPLSGPIAFDAITGDFWAYSKANGPIRWTISASQDVLTFAPGTSAVRQSHVGQLAANGGGLVFSRGTNIFVVTETDGFDPGQRSADISVNGPPQQLAISADGQQVAVIWGHPVRGGVWLRSKSGAWVSKFMTTDGPVLANLPEWNGDIAIPLFQQRTAEEKNLESQPAHFGKASLLTAAAKVPMVAWLRDPGQGIHLDYLGPQSCIHVATLPYDRERGLHRAVALSPDGTRLATANSSGEIRLWDIRNALRKLADLQLGISEIDLNHLSHDEQPPTSLIIAGQG